MRMQKMSTFKNIMGVMALATNASDSCESEAIFDSTNSISIGKRENGGTTSLQKTKSLNHYF